MSSSVFTFQSGSILMLLNLPFIFSHFPLYIPIWFYSNARRADMSCVRMSFTFQSGSILIQPCTAATSAFISFTFQSGSILIDAKFGQVVESIKPLHSNLVLF